VHVRRFAHRGDENDARAQDKERESVDQISYRLKFSLEIHAIATPWGAKGFYVF
jgi:hypothetical protein